MNLLVNGQDRQVPEGCTIAALLVELRVTGQRLAVERNGEIVPRSRHGDTALQAGDRVEVVQAIGGG